MTRKNYMELHKEVVARPGARERLDALRLQTLEEIRVFESLSTESLHER